MNQSAPINDQITSHFGGEHWPEVFRKLVANEEVLNALWGHYQAVMTEAEIDLQTKELMGLCVAIAKPNEYVTGLQQRRIRRVDVSDVGEQEAVAVAGFFEGLNAFTHALRVDSDIRPRNIEAGDTSLIDREINVNVPYIMDSDDPIVREVYDEIRSRMEISFVPNVFKTMAHQPTMLQAKWDSYKAIMLEGVLTRKTKELLAIAVSAVNGCDYCVDAHSAALRHLGMSQQGLVEAGCVVDLFTGLCDLAKGLRLSKKNF